MQPCGHLGPNVSYLLQVLLWSAYSAKEAGLLDLAMQRWLTPNTYFAQMQQAYLAKVVMFIQRRILSEKLTAKMR